jgi:hypothetical protein
MPRINLPDDAAAKVRRVSRKIKKPGVVAVCFWRGYGYAKYNHEIEDEHFARVCPDAPKILKANAKKRLG